MTKTQTIKKKKKADEPTKDMFPFEPNEKVKQAFRQDAKIKAAIKTITKAVMTVAIELEVEPWQVFAKEHPEVAKSGAGLRYGFDSAAEKVTRV